MLTSGLAADPASTSTLPETISIQRDQFGVPHIYAASDAGAYYAAGYVAAQDRLYQMLMTRVIMEGRAAEFFYENAGDKSLVRRDQITRLHGWKRHAIRTANALAQHEPELHSLLQAYCDGVNLYMSDPANRANHPMLIQFPLPSHIPWTVRDCLLAWYSIARQFAPIDGNEGREREDWDRLRTTINPLTGVRYTRAEILEGAWGSQWADDSAAVVQQGDFAPADLTAVQNFANAHRVQDYVLCREEVDPTFSNGLAVSSALTPDERSILLGEPRFPVGAPNTAYEWHMKGETFDVRGAGVAGSPNILVGSTNQCAWSVTSASVDQADAFWLDIKKDALGRPTHYWYENAWTTFEETGTENVKVRGWPSNSNWPQVHYRRTVWGSTVTFDLSPDPNDLDGDDELWEERLDTNGFSKVPIIIQPTANDIVAQNHRGYSIRRVPMSDPRRDPHLGYLAMYRAGDIDELHDAQGGVTFPSANIVFSDTAGDVGYSVQGAVPIRSLRHWLAPHVALDGSRAANGWKVDASGGTLVVPQIHKPHVLRPASGFVYSANHSAAGSWYPLRSLFPCRNHSERSYRLFTMLTEAASAGPITIGKTIAMHEDSVYQVAKEMVELCDRLRNDPNVTFTWNSNTVQSMPELKGWADAGGRLNDDHRGVVLAIRLSNALRPIHDPGDDLWPTYGLGWGGLVRFLQAMHAKEAANQQLDSDEIELVDGYIQRARADILAAGSSSNTPDLSAPSTWLDWWRNNKGSGVLNRWESMMFKKKDLIGNGVPFGPLVSTGLSAIADQRNAPYSQLVVLGSESSTAHSMLSLGQSEIPGHNHELDQQLGWEKARFKLSPMEPADVTAYSTAPPETIDMP